MTAAFRRTLLATVSLLAVALPVVVAAAPAAHASPAACSGNMQVTNTDNNTVIGSR